MMGGLEVVIIHIKRDRTGKPTEIVHPGDFGIRYWTREPNMLNPSLVPMPDPNLPHAVLWVADNLIEGEKLTIKAKPTQTDRFFLSDSYELDATHPTVSSGPVTNPPKPVKDSALGMVYIPARWAYNIEFTSPRDTAQPIDPTIIIDPEP